MLGLQRVEVGYIEMLFGNRKVFCDKKEVELTGLEFNLLWLLMNSAPEIVSRECIARSIFNRCLSESNQSINMHISTIRKKLVVDSQLSPIKAVRGKGYIFQAC